MKRTHQELDRMLEDTTAGLRAERLDGAVVKAAADRVWARMAGEQAAAEAGIAPVERIRSCDDFRALIPAYLHGYLSGARALLLEDHTRECLPCRKALKEARAAGRGAPAAAQPARGGEQAWAGRRWAIAAAVVVGLGLMALPWGQRFWGSVGTLQAVVQAANGPVYRVAEARTQRLAPGAEIARGERIRTARDAGAVVSLPDGSLIEMKERSEFSLTENAQGTTIRLERGQIIVQAAKQRGRQLYVATDDCLVAVKGTIFSVNSGTKGARVSVVEGEVQVDHSGKHDVLRPGDQVATHQSLDRVPVREEISWSRDAARYARLLAESEVARRALDEGVGMPGSRHSTRLLDLMPEGTVLYAAIPNLTGTLAEADRLLREQVAKSPELRAWYDQELGADGGIGQFIKQIGEFGQYLGPEIAIGAQREMIALAELKDAAGLRARIEQKLAEVAVSGKGEWAVQIIADPLAAAPGKEGDEPDRLWVWIRGDLAAASTDLGYLRQVATTLQVGGVSRFAAGAFHSALAGVYREGAGMLIAADLENLVRTAKAEVDAREQSTLEQLGLTHMRHFVVELKEVNGRPQNRAVLTTDGARRGPASWLAAPGPMGALEFISPEATVVGSFVVAEPTALVDDLLATLKTADPEGWQRFKDFEAGHGVNLRDDIAAPLGGECAFAVDGPLLPTPAWKAVFEVNDPARLQQSLERTVAQLNQWAAGEGKPGLAWEQAEVDGKTYYTIKASPPPEQTGHLGLEVSYAYAYGYLVAAPTRALVERAVRYRESGYTLLTSPQFRATLPEDKQANFSAMVYHNIAPTVRPLASGLGMIVENAPREGRAALAALATAKPALAYVYAQGDRLVLSANTEDGPLGLTPSTLLGLPGSFGQLLKGATK